MLTLGLLAGGRWPAATTAARAATTEAATATAARAATLVGSSET